MKLTEADRMTLARARMDSDREQSWAARRGDGSRAKRLAKAGLLRETGISAMGWTLYFITDAGRLALAPSGE